MQIYQPLLLKSECIITKQNHQRCIGEKEFELNIRPVERGREMIKIKYAEE